MNLSELNNVCKEIRLGIIEMLYEAQSGHPGGSLSAIEILTVLYFQCMNIRSSEPNWEGRDRFILSKGHASPVLYTTLAHRGYFDKKELGTFRKLNSHLQGHPNMLKTPGVDFSSGSLGQGLSVGLGMAMGLRRKGLSSKVFVLLGDGELNEGQNWEAIMSAHQFGINNLIPIVDYNRVQLDGTDKEIMDLMPMKEKWQAFNWNTVEIDGHDIDQVVEGLEEAITSEQPTVIIANTVKGKGVDFMEGRYQWHGKPMNREEYEEALRQLKGGVCHA